MTTIAQLIASHKAALAKMREMEAGPNAPDYDAAVEAESTAFETLARARSGRAFQFPASFMIRSMESSLSVSGTSVHKN